MTKLHTYLFLMLTCWSIAAAAQLPTATNTTDEKDRRQGDWVLYYDAEWEETSDTSKADYYREISYVDDKPSGLVIDFFGNGSKQWEGELISDRPDFAHGEIKYYYDNGNLELAGMMENNIPIGEWNHFTYLGKFSHNSTYINGVEQGVAKLIQNIYQLPDQNNYKFKLRHLLDTAVFEIYKMPFVDSNNLAADYLDLLIDIYIYTFQDYYLSLELNKKCLLIRQNIFTKEHPKYAFSLSKIALDYSFIIEFDESLKLYNESLKIYKKLYGIENEEYVSVLYEIALIHYHLGDYNKSLKLLEHCLLFREKKHGIDHPSYMVVQSLIATNYSSLGLYVKALNIFEKSLTVYEKHYGKNQVYYITGLLSLAIQHHQLGNFSHSIELNKECLEIKETVYGKEHSEYAKSLNNLALNYHKMGNYEKSLKLYKQSLSICEKVVGKEHPEYATTLSNLALNYSDLGNYEKAVELNKECLAIRKNIFGIKHPDYAISLNNLALNYHAMGNYENSIKLNKHCLAVYEKLYSKEHPSYAISLNNLALNYSDLGNYEKAVELNKECLTIRKNIFGIEHPNYAMSLNNLAMNYLNSGAFDKGLGLIKQCLAITEKLYGKEHHSYAVSLNNLFHSNFANDDYLACDSLKLQEYIILNNLYFKNSIGLSEKEKQNYIKDLTHSFEMLTNYTIFRKEGNPELASDISSASLNLKGALLSANQQIKDEVFSSGDTSLINLYESWKIGKVQLARYYEKTIPELAKNGVDLKAEEEQVNELEQQLSRKSLTVAESKKRYSWQDVKNKLNSDEAYVELIRIDHYDFKNRIWTDTVYYAALIIDNNTTDYPELVVLENGDQLEQAGYKYYVSHTAGKNRQYVDEYSYLNYWSAIAEKLEDKKRVYVSSDGVYNKLNLNVLYNNETGKYLGEEMDIRLLTSGRDLFKTYPKQENKELSAILVGSPKYDLTQDQEQVQVQEEELLVSRDLQQYWIDSLSRGWSVSALPGTAIEVSNISELMTDNKWKVTTYTEEQALEGKVKNVSSPTVLHIATHGYFFEDVEHEKESPSRMMGVDTKKATQNPLLRSGLLFTGAKNTLNGNDPKSGDNGLLTAYEASYMNLKGTELVVLSACETARGEIKNGEGVYGLQRAIQQAGARNIIMSLWKVDDKVTQEFMTLFYSHWLEGRPIREAFKTTQNTIKEKYPQPYYWGAFVLVEG
jgi:CHAT domain-containing protein